MLAHCARIASLTILLVALPDLARGAPAIPEVTEGIVVATGPSCRVLLTKVSYDDPGADDTEFIELHVLRDPASRDAGSCSREVDAISPVDGSVACPDSGAEQSLAGCGLAALQLVDGSKGGCDVYRTLPLADTRIPEDGYIVLCADASSLDENGLCDVTHAGKSALKSGWLRTAPGTGSASSICAAIRS